MFGFLGPNGAGKTTTIRMLMGILVPTVGHAHASTGLDCQRDRIEVKRRVGYLPDAPVFYDFLRGREIVQFVGEMHGQSRGVAADNAARLLDELGLADAAEEYAINYSTGMKKKLGLACALIHDPPVLILDEPTNGLDPRAAREVQERLRRSRGRRQDDLPLDAPARHGRAAVHAGRHHPPRRAGRGGNAATSCAPASCRAGRSRRYS